MSIAISRHRIRCHAIYIISSN